MDHSRLPYFATLRESGTVITRRKMDLINLNYKPEPCPSSDYPQARRRPTTCEKCKRTRLINNFSECDSEKVKVRRYRSSSARSRYVSSYTVVCLTILILGDILPSTSAAPHRRTMSRVRRSSEENTLWGNPCDYDTSLNSKPAKYSAKQAKDVAAQARNAYDSTMKYKDEIAKLHSYTSFEKLLPQWKSSEWLRKFTWFQGVLPQKKELNEQVPDEDLDKLMEHIDDDLPLMYKGLKVIVAGLYSISKDGPNDDISTDASLKHNITQSMHNVRAVLCLFNEIMRSRSLEIMPLTDSEVQEVKEDKLAYSLLVYRDTLNYLEYLSQVFQKMYEKDSAQSA